MGKIKISYKYIKEYTIINVTGDVQSHIGNHITLKRSIEDKLVEGKRKFVINLENAYSLCTAFAGTLIEMNNRIKRVKGRYLCLVKPWKKIDVLRKANIYQGVESFYNLKDLKKEKDLYF